MNVSVIVATYGDEKWKRLAQKRAIPSAEAQGDDVRVVRFHDASGAATLARSRNLAASVVRADWLCFLDADDELEPGYFDAMRKADFERADFYRATGSGPALYIPKVRYVIIPGDMRSGSAAAIPNQGGWPRVNECVIGTLVERGLFMRIGGFRDKIECDACLGSGNWTGWSGDDERTQEGGCPECGGTGGVALTMYEDWDLWLRCVDAGAERVYTDAVYRAHGAPGGSGRNLGPDPMIVYDAIWADHERRLRP